MYDKKEKWLMSVGLNSQTLDEIVKDELDYHHDSDIQIPFEKMNGIEKLKLIFEYHHGFYDSDSEYDFRIIKHNKKFALDDTEKLTNVNEDDIKKLSNVIELLTYDEALTEFSLEETKTNHETENKQKQSDLMEYYYNNMDDKTKKAVDTIMISVCGYSLDTIIHHPENISEIQKEIYSNAEKWFDNYLEDADRELLHKELDLKIAYPTHFDDLLAEDQEKVKQALLKEELENCSNCAGKGWYLGDTNPEIDNDYGEIECEKCKGTGVKEE